MAYQQSFTCNDSLAACLLLVFDYAMLLGTILGSLVGGDDGSVFHTNLRAMGGCQRSYWQSKVLGNAMQ